ncbi:NmrA family NAD(P)-binding protein [Lewinella sp. IMCC34191]|uniref:NmrA family NAD(P)-binding protein n=1 Tax=Lewinella sp. IMCC34191 TaxID=2259172 RepID=UPI000E27C6CC|nr:NmrA family NAD(P)-binding protein [Lewinella sp. IMCC34191]
MHIIITGSLGHIGRPLTEELLAKGHTLTVISSSESRRAEIVKLGVRAAIGSLNDASFLTHTFTGADLLYAMVPPDMRHASDLVGFYREVGENYARAIREAGVPRVIYLSSFGAELDHGTGNILGAHYVEETLKELAETDVTFIRPTSFYYNFLGFIGTIKATGKILANYGGPNSIPLVSPRDIAAAISEEVDRPGEHRKIRYVYSDERTGDEVAQVLGAAIGKPDLEWVVVPDADMKRGLLGTGMPEGLADNLTDLYASIHSGRLGREFQANKPAEAGNVKLEDYAPEFAAAYRNA